MCPNNVGSLKKVAFHQVITCSHTLVKRPRGQAEGYGPGQVELLHRESVSQKTINKQTNQKKKKKKKNKNNKNEQKK